MVAVVFDRAEGLFGAAGSFGTIPFIFTRIQAFLDDTSSPNLGVML